MALSILLCTILITIILSTKGKVDPPIVANTNKGGQLRYYIMDNGVQKLQKYFLKKGDKIAVTIKGTQKKKRVTFTHTYTCGVLTQDFLKVRFLAFDEVDSTNPTKHEVKHTDLNKYLKKVWEWKSHWWSKTIDGIKPDSPSSIHIIATVNNAEVTVPLKRDVESSAHAAYDDMMDLERARVRLAKQLDYGDLTEEYRHEVALENAQRKRTIARLQAIQREVRGMERAMISPR
eukprot:674791_1